MVRDEERAIIAAVNTLRAAHDYVFTTGGIGPTHDDITSEAVARAFNLPYRIHPEAKRILVDFYRDTGRELNEARMRMAHTPEGAALIENPVEPGAGLPGRERPRAGRDSGGDAGHVRERGADAEGRAHGQVARDCRAAGRGRRGRPPRRACRSASPRWRSAATRSCATATSARRWCYAHRHRRGRDRASRGRALYHPARAWRRSRIAARPARADRLRRARRAACLEGAPLPIVSSSPRGGIGRRIGLKIRWPSGRPGSNPGAGTIALQSET